MYFILLTVFSKKMEFFNQLVGPLNCAAPNETNRSVPNNNVIVVDVPRPLPVESQIRVNIIKQQMCVGDKNFLLRRLPKSPGQMRYDISLYIDGQFIQKFTDNESCLNWLQIFGKFSTEDKITWITSSKADLSTEYNERNLRHILDMLSSPSIN